MLAVATALNYLDRQSFPVVVRVVQRDIPISDREYSALQSVFLLAYSLMYAGGGRMVDRLGTRTGYTIIIIWWSVAKFSARFGHLGRESRRFSVLPGIG